jgi:hypothetical protein
MFSSPLYVCRTPAALVVDPGLAAFGFGHGTLVLLLSRDAIRLALTATV